MMIRNHIHASGEMGIPDSPERPSAPRAVEPAGPCEPRSAEIKVDGEPERHADLQPIGPPRIDYKGEGPGVGPGAGPDAGVGSEGGRRAPVVKNLPTLEAKPGPIPTMHSIETPRRKILMSGAWVWVRAFFGSESRSIVIELRPLISLPPSQMSPPCLRQRRCWIL